MRLALVVVAGSVLVFTPIGVCTQPTSPPKRAHHSVAYDPVSQRVIVANGSSPRAGGECCDMFNDIWSFDGTRWTSHGPSGDPMSGAALAFDTKRNRLTAFGSYRGGAGSGGDVRVLENNAWRSLAPHPSIIAAEPGFAYDSRRDRFIAFGGSGGRGQTHGDTWEWDGTAWREVVVPR